MSEPIPESIPTSANPRNKRPIKKRMLNPTPTDLAASQLEALFAKPDQEIRVPSTSNSLTKFNQHGQPPEIVANVQGSSAGAGSGEFHVYKASRRREYERLKAMDEEVRKETEQEVWEREKGEREERDRKKTRKNREKRERLKSKGKNGRAEGGAKNESVNVVRGPEGGLKPRAEIGFKETVDMKDENAGILKAVEEVGVIIHDDDD